MVNRSSASLAKQYTWKRTNDKAKKIQKRYYASPKGRATRSERRKARYLSDPQYRLGVILRSRTSAALKSQSIKKKINTFDLTGCSPIELQSWLVFRANWSAPGATMENYGEWQLDHIIPVGLWDLRCPLQRSLCFHWTNLQLIPISRHKVKTAADIRLIRGNK